MFTLVLVSVVVVRVIYMMRGCVLCTFRHGFDIWHRWAERKVVDVVLSHKGWLLVTTCARLNSEQSPASHSEALSSCMVSLYHPASRRSVQYQGTCGCFLRGAAGDEEGSDPLVAIYVSTPTSRGEQVYCVDLSKSEAVEHKNLPVEAKNLSEQGEAVVWSAALPAMQLPLGALPSTAVPGSLIAPFTEGALGRLVVLTSVGVMFVLSASDGGIIKTSSVSEEYIVSSDFHLSAPDRPTLYFLTGLAGRIVRIPPSAILTSS